jgi:hypothetical protein
VDLLLGGGGQDSGQLAVHSDLPRVAAPLRELVEAGAAAMMVCGMYQLFGNYFRTATGETIEGLGILNMHTVAGQGRMIGNITTQSTEFGEVIGYENHSGRTWLNAAQDDSESGHGDGSRNTEGRFFCVPGSNLVGDECLLPGTQKNRPSVSSAPSLCVVPLPRPSAPSRAAQLRSRVRVLPGMAPCDKADRAADAALRFILYNCVRPRGKPQLSPLRPVSLEEPFWLSA